MNKKLLFMLLLGIFLISFTTAATWDNIKYETGIGEMGYPNIEIKNALGFGETLFEASLNEHTHECGQNCMSKLEINHSGGVLIDDLEFRTIIEDGSYIVQPIRSYTLKYEAELPEYEIECHETGEYSINGTALTECNTVQVGTYSGYKYYNVGDELPKGKYELYLEGEKKPSRKVDWVFTVQGKVLDELAVWGNISLGDDAEVILNSPADGSAFYSNPVTFNATANVTGGATLINMSLWTNRSGTWEILNTSYYPFNVSIFNSYFKLDEISGTFVEDITGNNNGTSFNVTLGQDGKINYSYYFQGPNLDQDSVDDSHIELTTENNMRCSSGNCSASIWFKYDTSKTSGGTLISKDNSFVDGNANGWSIGVNAPTNGSLYVVVFNANSQNITYSSGVNLTDGNWHHAIVIFGEGGHKIYIDGVFNIEDLTKIKTSGTGGTLNPLAIGALYRQTHNAYWSGFNGNIDEVGLFNYSISEDINEIYTYNTIAFNNTILESTLWNVQACDSDDDCGFATQNYTANPDTIAPKISIISPTSVIDTHIIGDLLNLNVTVTDVNLDTCWYEYNNTNTTFSCTTGIQANETFNTVQGEQSITIYANDSLSNVNSSTQSWIYNFVENSATYNDPAYETSNEEFILNFTTDITVQSISANLIYSGDEYESTSSCDGSTCALSNTVDLPILSAGAINNTFYWEFTIFNGTSSNTYNSTSRTQEVNNIILIECNATYVNKTLNFTAWDEGDLTQLKPFMFDGAFDYWLGSGNTYKTYSLTNSSTNETDLCLFPITEDFYIDASISYDSSAGAGTYTERTYYFDNHKINSTLQNIELLLLSSEDSTSFIQEVLEDQIKVQGALIYTYKYYPGIDDYKITQITKTNADGKTVGFYEAEVSRYRHNIYLDETLIYSEDEPYKIIPTSTPYTITFNIGSPVEIPFEVYDDELDLSKSLTHNPTTDIVTYSYTDTNTTNTGARLLIIKENYATTDEVISNSTSSLSSAVLTYDLSNETGNFIAQAFITRAGEEMLVDSIRFTIDDKIDTFGTVGVLLGWFIILVAMMAFIYDATIGLIAVNLAIMFVNLIGFVSFSIPNI